MTRFRPHMRYAFAAASAAAFAFGPGALLAQDAEPRAIQREHLARAIVKTTRLAEDELERALQIGGNANAERARAIGGDDVLIGLTGERARFVE